MEYMDHEGAPALDDTQERQEALRRYHILDTPPEKNFDQITRLVAQVTDTPTALITLIDKERQWFKSCFGYHTRETDVEVSFCVHAVHERQTLVVEDARQDPRFKDSPLVTGEPGWRFYAGAPLRAPEGVHIGTLCIIDYEPRVFDARQRAVLEDLADLVVGQFELRSAEAQYRKLFRGTPQPALIYDIDTLEVLDANGAATRAYGYSERELRTLTLTDLVEADAIEAHTKRSTHAAAPFTARHHRRDGTPLVVEVREESILFDGRQARVAVMTDVAEREHARRYQRLVENVQEVVFETDLGGNATFLNAAWERITGFSAEEALGDSLLHYVHPKDRVESLQAFAPVLQQGKALFRHRARFLTSSGATLPMQFRVRLYTDEDGAPAGTVGTLTPLEEGASGPLPSATADAPPAEAPGAAAGDAAPRRETPPPPEAPPPAEANAVASADVNEREEPTAPPTADAAAETKPAETKRAEDESAPTEAETEIPASGGAGEATPPEEAGAEDEGAPVLAQGVPALDEIEGDASAAGEALIDVRERLSASPPQLRAGSIDVAEHLRHTLDELEPVARQKGLVVHRTLPDRAVSIEADAGALHLLVAALVNNAIAATEEGAIAVSGRVEGEDVHLRVADTGADISKQLLNSLLDSDLDSEEAEEPQQQHLRFVHRLVNLMEGAVEMERQRGQGTVFTVRLPRHPGTDDDSEDDASATGSTDEREYGGQPEWGSSGWDAFDTGEDAGEPGGDTPAPEDDSSRAGPGGATPKSDAPPEQEEAGSATSGGGSWRRDSIFSTDREDDGPADDAEGSRGSDSPFSL